MAVVSLVGPASKPQRRRALAVGCACLAALAGCASGGTATPDAQRVTVTRTPASPVTQATPATPTSDVVGRRFDIGTVSDGRTVDGVRWLRLDRWTVTGVSDAKLARDGVPVAPHTGERFTNKNNDRLRDVPLAPGAMVVVNACVKNGDQLGLTSTPQDAVTWLDSADPATVLLLTYDAAGRVVRMDTDPRC